MNFINEEDFTTAELNDSVCSEEPVHDRHWLFIHLQLHNWPYRLATPPPQSIQEDVLTEAEPMDFSILDDLQNVINVPGEELYLFMYLSYGVYSEINSEVTFEFG